MGPHLKHDSTVCHSPEGKQILTKDFEDMIRVDGQASPTGNQACGITSAPATPLTPGTPLGPPTTPTAPVSHRHRLPSFTETDSQSSTCTASDNISDTQSESSETDWANFDISPLVKEELKQTIFSRRKTHGLPEVKPDFSPKPSEKLTPEEEQRRQQQKERNRTAAAKCRGKKRHAVERLVDEAQQLETANTQLRNEVDSLEAERQRLQFLLDIHMPKCTMVTTLPASQTNASVASSSSRNSKRAKVSASLQPAGGIVSVAGTTRPTTATTPSSQSGYMSSCFPPTPSTTHSQSSTEPSTPVMLTPTSVMDAPNFPQTISPTTTSHCNDAILTTTFVQQYLGDDPIEADDLTFAADSANGGDFMTGPTKHVSSLDGEVVTTSDTHSRSNNTTSTTTTPRNQITINDQDFDALTIIVTSDSSVVNPVPRTDVTTNTPATEDAVSSAAENHGQDEQQLSFFSAEPTLQSLLQSLQPTDDQPSALPLFPLLGFSLSDSINPPISQASSTSATGPQHAGHTSRTDYPDLVSALESSLSVPTTIETSHQYDDSESDAPEMMNLGLCNTS